MANTFKSGDKVRLATGGPDMTVKEEDTTAYTFVKENPLYVCQWFDGSKLTEAKFRADTLVASKPLPPPSMA